MGRHLPLLATLLVALGSGCVGELTPPSPAADPEPVADAGPVTDAGADDGDAGAPAGDAGPANDTAEAADAGSPPADAGPVVDAGPPLEPVRDDLEDAGSPQDRARGGMDRVAIAAALAEAGVALPAGAEVFAVRIEAGAGGPASRMYEAGEGAFSVDFWPASSIKLLAAVGALEMVAGRGFTGAAEVRWDSGYGDDLAAIYDRAIRVSSNADYDRLIRVAGYDWLNTELLRPGRGFEVTVITSSYGGIDVRDVSGMTLREGGREDYVPRRVATGSYGRNDTNLFELVDGLRRVMLHHELPAAERFALADADVAGLADALCGANHSYFEPGARDALGPGTRVCHKAGWVPSAECVDHALIEAPAGARFLLAATAPYAGCADALAAVARHALPAVADGLAPPLEADAGVAVRVQLDDAGLAGGAPAQRATIEVEGADRVELWVDAEPVVSLEGAGRFETTRPLIGEERALISVRAWSGDRVIAFRAGRASRPGP